MPRQHRPHDIVIHGVIAMHHDIPHTDDLPPWDVRVERACFSRDIRRRLANRLYQVERRAFE